VEENGGWKEKAFYGGRGGVSRGFTGRRRGDFRSDKSELQTALGKIFRVVLVTESSH
jgi:hypothetical protein